MLSRRSVEDMLNYVWCQYQQKKETPEGAVLYAEMEDIEDALTFIDHPELLDPPQTSIDPIMAFWYVKGEYRQ